MVFALCTSRNLVIYLEVPDIPLPEIGDQPTACHGTLAGFGEMLILDQWPSRARRRNRIPHPARAQGVLHIENLAVLSDGVQDQKAQMTIKMFACTKW